MPWMFTLFVLAIATPASAELIFFAGDRSMSVASHRIEDDRIIVTLRGGGEMSFNHSLVTRIEPDEVPFPEEAPAEAQEPTALASSAALAGQTSFDPLIVEVSDRHGVDARLVKAVIQVESSFQPRARSPKGAMGLMQLMPATAREYKANNPYDPQSNIEAGTRYLSKLLRQFDLPLALAAYNAGEAAVRQFGGIPPYAETRNYVAKVLSLLK